MLLRRLGDNQIFSPPVSSVAVWLWRVVTRLRVPAFFLLLASLLLWPVVYAGDVPYWGGTLLQFYPWRKLVAEMLRDGQLPLWNPYLGLGAPLAANLQSAVFYPLNLLFVALPIEKALGYSNVLHLALAGLGLYLFCRALGASAFPALIGGLTYMLSGFMVARLIFPGHVDAMVWLPFVLYGVETVVQAAADPAAGLAVRWRAPLGGFLLAMLLLAGHMQVAFYSAWAIAAYALIRVLRVAWQAFRTPHAFRRLAAARAVLWLGIMALLGVGLSAVQLMLTGELAMLSARAAETDRDFMMLYSLLPVQLLNLLAPDSFGNPATGTYWGPGNYWEGAAYVGVLPLVLAIAGFKAGKWPVGLRLFFSLFAVIAILLALGRNLPVYPLVFDHVPGFSLFQAPTRLLFLYVLAVAVLAAFGAEVIYCRAGLVPLFRKNTRRLLRTDVKTEKSLAVEGRPSGLGLVTAGIGIALGAIGARFALAGTLGNRITVVDGWWRFGLLLALCGLVLGLRARLGSRLAAVAALGLLLADLLAVDLFLNPATDAASYRAPTASAAFLSAGPPLGRIFTPHESFLSKFFARIQLSTFGSRRTADVVATRETLLPNLAAAEHLYEVYNYDPLQVQDVNVLRTAIERAGFPLPLLAALNVTWVLSDTAPSPWFGEAVVAGGTSLYAVEHTLPRAYLVPGVSVAESHDEALSILLSSDFDPTRTVVLERGGLEGIDFPAGSPPSEGTVEILDYTGTSVRMRAAAPGQSLLVLSDTCYPGWRATVDGRPAAVLRANYALRAVLLPAGEHRVEFVYDPPLLKSGLIISTFSALAGIALALTALRAKRVAPRA